MKERRSEKIPYNKPFIAGKELYYIAQAVMVDSHLSGDGKFSGLCHAWLEKQFGAEKAFLTHSCTAALEMAAILCGTGPGDEVIMPSYTFVSTANAFVLRGGVPVFVDIKPDTLNIDEELIEDLITERTKAIVPVHYAGVACNMDAVMEIANRHGIYVVEDAAQAFLSKQQGRFLGTIGHFGCLSFHETKNIISGEGGALLINNPEAVEKAEIIREKGTNRGQFFRGMVDKYTWVDIGSSYLPSELTGAFLYAQLEMSEKIIAARARIFQRYLEALRPLERNGRLRLPYVGVNCECNGHIFYIITGSPEERAKLIRFLKDRGITAIFHYVPLHSSPAGEKYGRIGSTMDVTNDVSDKLLRLPLYYEMPDRDVDRVTEAIFDFYSN